MTKIKMKPRGKKTDRTLPASKCKCAPELEQWLIPIADLTIDPENARSHPVRSIESLKASLSRFGFQKPIVADASGRVVAGNGQLEAAIALGWTHVPVVKTKLSREEARAYAIADNRTAELSMWNIDLLTEQLKTVNVSDLSSLGFDRAECDQYLAIDQPDLDRSKPLLGSIIYRVVIECKDESQQREIATECEKKGWACQLLMS